MRNKKMLVSLLVPHCSAFMNFFIHLCETRHVLMKMFGFCMRLLTTLDCSHKKVPYNMFVKTCKCFVRQYVAKYRHCYYSTSNKELLSYDPYQAKLMEQECILVDNHDKVIGSKSKYTCHLHSENLPLHRAFSLFLFNSKGELLLQQRSSSKITFPEHFTNTCCSHPLYNDAELDQNNHVGVKLAAQRRMKEELGVDRNQLPVDCMKFLTRIHYRAPSCDKWGEHEIDYVLFVQKDIDLNLNPNEVSQVKYISLDGFAAFLLECKRKKIPITPWFDLIAKTFLLQWWRDLTNLNKYANQKEIIRLIR